MAAGETLPDYCTLRSARNLVTPTRVPVQTPRRLQVQAHCRRWEPRRRGTNRELRASVCCLVCLAGCPACPPAPACILSRYTFKHPEAISLAAFSCGACHHPCLCPGTPQTDTTARCLRGHGLVSAGMQRPTPGYIASHPPALASELDADNSLRDKGLVGPHVRTAPSPRTSCASPSATAAVPPSRGASCTIIIERSGRAQAALMCSCSCYTAGGWCATCVMMRPGLVPRAVPCRHAADARRCLQTRRCKPRLSRCMYPVDVCLICRMPDPTGVCCACLSCISSLVVPLGAPSPCIVRATTPARLHRLPRGNVERAAPSGLL